MGLAMSLDTTIQTLFHRATVWYGSQEQGSYRIVMSDDAIAIHAPDKVNIFTNRESAYRWVAKFHWEQLLAYGSRQRHEAEIRMADERSEIIDFV